MPRLGFGPVTGLPHMSTSPLVGASKPATMRSNVDLPQPEAPMRQMNSPLRTVRLAFRNASIDWPFTANVLLTFLISRIGRALRDMGRIPRKKTSADQHDDLIRQETEDADHEHDGDDDFCA